MKVNILARSRTCHLAARVIQSDLVPLGYLKTKKLLFSNMFYTLEQLNVNKIYISLLKCKTMFNADCDHFNSVNICKTTTDVK
jgi:hypothetical protein